jgi:hypothetical protein
MGRRVTLETGSRTPIAKRRSIVSAMDLTIDPLAESANDSQRSSPIAANLRCRGRGERVHRRFGARAHRGAPAWGGCARWGIGHNSHLGRRARGQPALSRRGARRACDATQLVFTGAGRPSQITRAPRDRASVTTSDRSAARLHAARLQPRYRGGARRHTRRRWRVVHAQGGACRGGHDRHEARSGTGASDPQLSAARRSRPLQREDAQRGRHPRGLRWRSTPQRLASQPRDPTAGDTGLPARRG